MNPEVSQDVADSFPEILLLLLSTAIPTENCGSSYVESPDDVHRQNCVVLGKLVDRHPDVLGQVFRLSVYTHSIF